MQLLMDCVDFMLTERQCLNLLERHCSCRVLEQYDAMNITHVTLHIRVTCVSLLQGIHAKLA